MGYSLRDASGASPVDERRTWVPSPERAMILSEARWVGSPFKSTDGLGVRFRPGRLLLSGLCGQRAATLMRRWTTFSPRTTSSEIIMKATPQEGRRTFSACREPRSRHVVRIIVELFCNADQRRIDAIGGLLRIRGIAADYMLEEADRARCIWRPELVEFMRMFRLMSVFPGRTGLSCEVNEPIRWNRRRVLEAESDARCA